MQFSCRTTAISFEKAADIAADSSRLAELGRSSEQEAIYTTAMESVRSTYQSVSDYILITKFLVPSIENEDGKLCAVPNKFVTSESIKGLLPHSKEATVMVLTPNDYPYHFTPDVYHYILWKWSSNDGSSSSSNSLSEEEIQLAEDKLKKKYQGVHSDTCRFTNPPSLQSIKDLDHVHLLVRVQQEEDTVTNTLSIAARHRELVIPATKAGMHQAAQELINGRLLAFPTETVYGLGANALNEEAVLSIFAAKGRPLTDPLIVHVHEQSAADSLVDLTETEQEMFHHLGDKFWPGPLTLIVKASAKIPMSITAQTGFVGIRVPAHKLAKELLQIANIPVAAPSANRFGHVSPTRCSHVLADLGDKGVHVLDGEGSNSGNFEDESSDKKTISCEHGIESTVLKIDGANKKLIVFRQGAVSLNQLSAVCKGWMVEVKQRHVKMEAEPTTEKIVEGEESGLGDVSKSIDGQEAPGQAITHYAPDVPCYMILSRVSISQNDSTPVGSGTGTDVLTLTREQLQSTVIVDFGGKLLVDKQYALAHRDLSTDALPKEAASQLFDALRWAELQQNAELVLITAPPTEGSDDEILLGGLYDRMHRAASGNLVHLHVVEKK